VSKQFKKNLTLHVVANSKQQKWLFIPVKKILLINIECTD
jgi:hypothetical protein